MPVMKPCPLAKTGGGAVKWRGITQAAQTQCGSLGIPLDRAGGQSPPSLPKRGLGQSAPMKRNAANSLAAKKTPPFPSQYSEVSKTVVTERSASVIT